MAESLPGVRTRQLIEEMRQRDERERKRHEEAMADIRRRERITNEYLQESRDVTRALLAELRDHGERMRLGFDATNGALTDLSREIRGWRDASGPGASA